MMVCKIIIWKVLLLVLTAEAQLEVGIPAPPVMVLPETFNTEVLSVEGPMAVLPPLPTSIPDVRPQPLSNPAPPLSSNTIGYQLTTTATPTSTMSTSLFLPPKVNGTLTSSTSTPSYPVNGGQPTSTVSSTAQVGRPQLAPVGSQPSSQSAVPSTTPGNYQNSLSPSQTKPPNTRLNSNGPFVIEIDESENKGKSYNITLTISNVSNGTKLSLQNDRNNLD